MKAAKNNKGFTLLELLIAMLVTSLLMGGVYSVFNAQIRVATAQEETAAVQQNLRSAAYVMEQEIRMAGYEGTQSNIGAGFTAAEAASMSFTYLSDTTGDLTTVQYTFTDSDGDGDLDINRIKDGTSGVIAENIEEIEFYYTMVDDDGTISNDTHATPADPTELRLIKSVQVSILARTAKTIQSISGARMYTTPAGTVWGNTSTVGTDSVYEDYNDELYRRYMTTNIICRNL